jgi:hypothetical protein
MRPTTADDPLLQAIAQLREEVDRLFDEQAAHLRLMEAHAVSPEVAPSSSRRTPESMEQRFDKREAAVERPQAAGPASEMDPRNRLDALARHLDDRLRRRREGSGDCQSSPPGPAGRAKRSAP